MLAYAMVKPLDQMYEAHHSMVFRTAYRITGNAADAEDVLQTVFLRMVRGNPEVENPESYLRRSAVNAALDVVRARHDNDTLEPERMAASGSCTELSELRDTLRRELSKLPPRNAEMFAMRFFEGYTNPEIAKLLGISQVVVAVTLHRTRRKLQREMGGSR
ncbi:MAG: sigma-70 family RNA polymerase sigma factor [Bryobacteraceae bacterium]